MVVQQVDIAIQSPSPFTLSPGQTDTLGVVVPQQGLRRVNPLQLQWASSDANVARVSLAGVVTAVAAGRATIAVRGLLQQANVELTVHRPVTGLEVRPPRSADVLVPREETELLGRNAVAILRDHPGAMTVIDMCCGSGNLALGIAAEVPEARVFGADLTDSTVALARRNVERLSLGARVLIRQGDLFAALDGEGLEGTVDMIVCNPPWVPAKPTSAVEHAVYDPGSRMLRGFLSGLAPALLPGGEGWLVLSDIAEHLGLRTREELLALANWRGDGALRY